MMNDNEGFFVGFFTFMLFIATFLLWQSLKALWEAGERQIAVAKESADAAKESAEVAAKALIAGQRASIKAEITPGPLVFDNNGLSANVDVRLSNIGQIPATNVAIHAWLVVMGGSVVPWDEQRRRCAEIGERPIWGGFSVFPGDRFPDNIGVGGFGVGMNASKEDIIRGTIELSEGRKMLFLSVIGCVDYTFATDSGKHHQTGFIFTLNKITGPPYFISPDDQRIEKTDLMLMEPGIGSGSTAD
jgi:hypothetical protein